MSSDDQDNVVLEFRFAFQRAYPRIATRVKASVSKDVGWLTMNVSASLRASFYGPNGLLGLPPQSKRDTMAGDVKALRWRSTLVPINYVDYNSYCRQIKEEVNRESISVFFSLTIFPGEIELDHTNYNAFQSPLFRPRRRSNLGNGVGC